MKSESLLSSWIFEALGASGASASPLNVAKVVWERHERDLHAAGDLLFTWQLDLHTTADAMVTEGKLLVEENGDWRLPEGSAVPPPVRRTWSEDEIATAVEGYVAMLRAEHAGTPLRRSQILADIAASTSRSSDQLAAMMSNISAVVQEHGLTPLRNFEPRSNVPVGVRPAVAAALGT